jgi:hypothetical protein
MNIPQDAQKGHPARPQRVKARGGTYRTSCGPITRLWVSAIGETPSAILTSENLLRYVEGLNDARTKLADFFNILLVEEGEKL